MTVSASSKSQLRPAADVSTALRAKYFRAFGDVTRLRILELLMDGPLTVTELTQVLRVP